MHSCSHERCWGKNQKGTSFKKSDGRCHVVSNDAENLTHEIKFLFDMISFLTSDDRVGHEFRCINNTSFPEAGTTRI